MCQPQPCDVEADECEPHACAMEACKKFPLLLSFAEVNPCFGCELDFYFVEMWDIPARERT